MKPVAKAADWWRITPLSDGVTLVDEPHILPFYRCNVWHIRGRDGDMLVDSGMGVVSLREWVPLVTERPLQAVASHTHFDHIGCHHEFACRCRPRPTNRRPIPLGSRPRRGFCGMATWWTLATGISR